MNLPFLSPVPQLSCFFFFNGEGTGTEIEVTAPQIRIGALPNAPKSLKVLPLGHNRIQLHWQPSETPNVRSYRIYRRGQLIAEVKADEISWTDTTVRSGEAYGYFVTAVVGLDGTSSAAPSFLVVADKINPQISGKSHLPLHAEVESLPSWQDATMPLPETSSLVPRPSSRIHYDVIVVGATPAGIAAAISAARLGHQVALVERTNHIGGMMTGGLSATDRRYRQASGGLFAE
ncbi:MAG: FAD-dependent oxidoreductase, partial [Armatimonadetes bacterium]|nr:FAD-dependent oxidoreductase [Armatimonadota bacterium]